MISTRSECKRLLSTYARDVLDPCLLRNGYVLDRLSQEYMKSRAESAHSLTLSFEFHPPQRPEVAMYLTPICRFRFPTVSKLATEMLDSDSDLIASPEIVLSQPLDVLASANETVYWYASSDDELALRLREIASIVESRLLSLFDECASIAGLLRLYESSDNRILWQQRSFVFVIAGYILNGHIDEARAALERHYGKARSRRQYANAFKFMDRF